MLCCKRRKSKDKNTSEMISPKKHFIFSCRKRDGVWLIVTPREVIFLYEKGGKRSPWCFPSAAESRFLPKLSGKIASSAPVCFCSLNGGGGQFCHLPAWFAAARVAFSPPQSSCTTVRAQLTSGLPDNQEHVADRLILRATRTDTKFPGQVGEMWL